MKIPFFSRKYTPTEKKEITELRSLVQAYSDILSKNYNTSTQSFTGNSYTTYYSQVCQLSSMYNGKSAWGCDSVRAIVDLRSSYIMGAGIHLTTEDPKEVESEEFKYLKDFLAFNKLDGKLAVDWAREAELEGKFLNKLNIKEVNGDKKIKAIYISYVNSKYKVVPNQFDYTEYEAVKYYVKDRNTTSSYDPDTLAMDSIPSGATEHTIQKGEFIFTRFGGRTDNVNETSTRIHLVIDKIEALAKAIRDWREIDHLFSSPTPTFQCETPEEAEELNKLLTGANWKIGKLLVIGNCEYKLVGPDIKGIESLIKEILTLSREISLATGLPVHFLGYPDLLQGRDTADQIMELLFASTRIERSCWVSHYNALFDAVLELANKQLNKKFRTGIVKCELPQNNSAALKEIVNFWLTLFNSNGITRETLLSKVPGIDHVEESKKMQELQDSGKLQHTNGNGPGINSGVDNPNPTGQQKKNPGEKGSETKQKQKSAGGN